MNLKKSGEKDLIGISDDIKGKTLSKDDLEV